MDHLIFLHDPCVHHWLTWLEVFFGLVQMHHYTPLHLDKWLTRFCLLQPAALNQRTM